MAVRPILRAGDRPGWSYAGIVLPSRSASQRTKHRPTLRGWHRFGGLGPYSVFAEVLSRGDVLCHFRSRVGLHILLGHRGSETRLARLLGSPHLYRYSCGHARLPVAARRTRVDRKTPARVAHPDAPCNAREETWIPP